MRKELLKSNIGGKFFFLKIEVMGANDRELNGEQFSPQSTYMKVDSITLKNRFFIKVGAFSLKLPSTSVTSITSVLG